MADILLPFCHLYTSIEADLRDVSYQNSWLIHYILFTIFTKKHICKFLHTIDSLEVICINVII